MKYKWTRQQVANLAKKKMLSWSDFEEVLFAKAEPKKINILGFCDRCHNEGHLNEGFLCDKCSTPSEPIKTMNSLNRDGDKKECSHKERIKACLKDGKTKYLCCECRRVVKELDGISFGSVIIDEYFAKTPTPSEQIKLEEIEKLSLVNASWAMQLMPNYKEIMTEAKVNELIDWSHKVNKILKGK